MCTVLNEYRCMLQEGWFQTGVCNKYKSVFIGVLRFKIPCILWNPNVVCCVQNWVPRIPILSQINPVALPSYFFKAHFSVFSPSISRSSKWSVFLRFHHENLVCIYPCALYMPRVLPISSSLICSST